MTDTTNKIHLKINKSESDIDAIIATFPCKPPVEANDTVKLYKKQHSKAMHSHNQQVLLSESDDVQYAGFNYGDQAPISNMFTKYMVGIFNKEKNKLQILNTSYFIMNPNYIKPDDILAVEKQEETKSFSNQVQSLVRAFGTSKSRRVLDARDRNKIDEGTLQINLESAIENVSFTETPTTEEATDKYLPICNEKATHVTEIYPIDNIISSNEMDLLLSLTKEFDEIKAQDFIDWENNKKYPSFIINHLRSLPSNQELKSIKIRHLLYLNYMIKLYKIPSYMLRKKASISSLEMPQLIKTQLLKKFTKKVAGNTNQITIPTYLRDSLLLNILILCLTLDSFTTNIKTLNMDVSGGKDLNKYFRQLGCKIASDKATLSVPFVKPNILKRAWKKAS